MVSIKSLLLISSSLLLTSIQVTGQWALSGKVVDAESGEGLSYVNITFPSSPYHNTTSDHKGQFRIEGLTNTSYGVVFSMIGFKTIHLDSVVKATEPLFISLQPETYLTKEVVVSAARKSQSLHLAPASVGLVTRNQLLESGTTSFDDAFHGINGITVTRSSGSNVQALSIRGASEVAGGGIGNRVLLLLDGRPAITPESGGALWNLIPLGVIERIEVIKGAYSSLFGSSAMGGIVNIITRTPDTTSRTDILLHYGLYDKPPAYAQYSGYHDFSGGEFITSRRLGKWSYLFNGAARANDGHRESSSFRVYNGYGKFNYAFSPNRSLQMSAMYNDIFNDTPATWLSTSRAYSVAEHRKDDTQHRREWNADLHYQAFAHSHLKYSTRFYYYSAISDYIFNGDPDNDSTNVNFGKQFVDEEKVIVHRLGNSTQVDRSLGDQHYLIGGIEIQSDFVDGRPDTVLYGVHRAWNIGVYIQDQFLATDKWTITAGARYDHYNITGTFMEGNVNPKIAAVYQASPVVSFRTLLARAFRNPSIAERYTKFEQGGGLRFTTSPFLKAEKLTLSAELGSKIIVKNFKADIAVFYNKYKDLISYRQRSAPGEPLLFEVINLNKAVMQGLEISAEYSLNRLFTLQAGYTFLDARDASENRINEVLPYKSKHTVYTTITTGFKKIHLYLQARSRSRIDEVFIYPGSEPDGYLLFNGKLSYTFSEHFSSWIKVDNISDVQYEEIERYRMAGRSYSMGMQFSF